MAVRAEIAHFNQVIVSGGISLEEYNSIVDALEELKAAVMTKMYILRLQRGDPLHSTGESE
jgi:hypothetical protein